MQAWCVDCRTLSPKTETLYELGAEGWRVVGSANGAHFEWRCPTCWLAFKELMWEASASSARFRAAAAIERGSSHPPPPMERTGERPVHAEGSPDAADTNHDSRLTMIASVIGDVFRVLSPVLSEVPSSSRARDLVARAERHASLVSHWELEPPGQDEQIALFEEASRVHADAEALVAAHRRSARATR